jgi:hypothetical protein
VSRVVTPPVMVRKACLLIFEVYSLKSSQSNVFPGGILHGVTCCYTSSDGVS